MRTMTLRLVPLAAMVLAACDRDAGPPPASATAAAGGHASTSAPATRTIRTASRPADACGWISASEISKIVGPLTGKPHPDDDGCLYPLPVDSETARRRTEAREVKRLLEERYGKPDAPGIEPEESGVVVDVEAYSDPAGARAAGAAMTRMAGWLQDGDADSSDADSATAAHPDAIPSGPLPGWDRTDSPTSPSFDGRIGHVRIRVLVHSAEVTRDQSVAIANQIRESIPDLPFPAERRSDRAGPDPCILLGAGEAEAVLGRLVVPPYRADEGTPLAMAEGKSCAYYTAGHHALVLTPTWRHGATALKAMRAVGGLLEGVAPALHDGAADTLDFGPWDEAGSDPATGQLYFLKGDRLVEVGYFNATTDFHGAVRIARTALGHL